MGNLANQGRVEVDRGGAGATAGEVEVTGQGGGMAPGRGGGDTEGDGTVAGLGDRGQPAMDAATAVGQGGARPGSGNRANQGGVKVESGQAGAGATGRAEATPRWMAPRRGRATEWGGGRH